MKNLIDSDWLRVVQLKYNTSARRVTPVQIAHRISGLWFAKRQKKILSQRWTILRKMMTKLLCGNFEKSFLEEKQMA